jgi:uroporphyrinogen decarboxylase
MLFSPLSRDEVVGVIDGQGQAARVPVLLHFWTHADAFGDRSDRVRALLAEYPEDAQVIGAQLPGLFVGADDDPEYRWLNYPDPEPATESALDERVAIPDWSLLDGILRDFPSIGYPGMFPYRPKPDGRYRLGTWWFWLFERHWQLRGMTNALTDFVYYPEETHRLYRALTDFYIGVIERGKRELDWDGVFTSDDLGTQKGPFFSPATFREFFKPYYRETIARAHELGMHFWMHCCGNIEPIIPDLVEIGLDVLHPIQKYTMDERTIAERHGKDICIWAGFDVQQTIPWGTVEDVRREVRFMMDAYRRPAGRLMFTAGNGINGDCPVESLEALFDEAFTYGKNG